MSEARNSSTESLRHIAEIDFRSKTAKLYESPIRDANGFKDRYQKEGIASGGKYARKAADAIFEKFETIEQLFEEAFITQPWTDYIKSNSELESTEQWLRTKAHESIDWETKRAHETTTKVCSCFVIGGNARKYSEPVRVEGTKINQRLNDAITIWKLKSKNLLDVEEQSEEEKLGMAQETTLAIFVSHSSHDETVALKLVELLRAALNLSVDQIRCTSVDGYRLPAGAHSESQLRKDINSAKAFIGLITPKSMVSTYVLFELGARWGARLHLIPLLAGIEPDALRAPLTALNPIVGKSEPQLHQLIEDVAKLLERTVQGVPSYAGNLSELARLLGSVASQRDLPISPRPTTPNLTFTGSHQATVSETGIGLWTAEVGRFQTAALMERGHLALLARFTNEARNGIRNFGALVKAHLVYRSEGREIRRIGGSWIDLPTDFAEFKVDDTHQLVIAVNGKTGLHVIAKRRIQVNASLEETRSERLPLVLEPNADTTVAIRLTDANTGEILFEREFKLSVTPLRLTES